MGPGPSDVHPRVLAAMARPTIGHLDPEFVRMMDELKELLRYAFQTANQVTFAVSAPGSVGMETCFVNLVEPGDKVLVCRNGVFGARQLENVKRCGGVPRAWWTTSGARRSRRTRWPRPWKRTRRCASSPSCTARRRPACARTPRPWRASPASTTA